MAWPPALVPLGEKPTPPARRAWGWRLAGGGQGRAVDDRDGERLSALGTGAEPRPGAMLMTHGAAIFALESHEPPNLARM